MRKRNLLHWKTYSYISDDKNSPSLDREELPLKTLLQLEGLPFKSTWFTRRPSIEELYSPPSMRGITIHISPLSNGGDTTHSSPPLKGGDKGEGGKLPFTPFLPR